MTTTLRVTFDGVNDVPRLPNDGNVEWFGGFLGYYSVYVGDDRFEPVATLSGSDWRVNTLRLVGENNLTTLRDLDAGAGRNIDLLQLGRNSDVDLISTKVEFIFGWDGGEKHSVTLGDSQQGNTKSIALFAAVNEITTGNAFVQSIDTDSREPSRAIIEIGQGGVGSIRTSDGNDNITVKGYANLIQTSGGNDTIRLGDEFVEFVSAGAGKDKLFTGSNYVGTARMGDDNDVVTMGTGGAAQINLGSGNDKILVNDMPEPFYVLDVWGSSGTDTIDFKKISGGVTFDLSDSAGQNLTAPENDDFSEGVGSIRVLSVENALGTGKSDDLMGSARDNKLVGRGGNDRLEGKGGNDLLIGNKGRDTFVFGQDGSTDRVKGYSKTSDTIEIVGNEGKFRSLDISKNGNNLEIAFDNGSIVLLGKGDLSLSASDFDFV